MQVAVQPIRQLMILRLRRGHQLRERRPQLLDALRIDPQRRQARAETLERAAERVELPEILFAELDDLVARIGDVADQPLLDQAAQCRADGAA